MILGVDDVATLEDASSKHLVLFNQTSSILDYYFPSILRNQLIDYERVIVDDNYTARVAVCLIFELSLID